MGLGSNIVKSRDFDSKTIVKSNLKSLGKFFNPFEPRGGNVLYEDYVESCMYIFSPV